MSTPEQVWQKSYTFWRFTLFYGEPCWVLYGGCQEVTLREVGPLAGVNPRRNPRKGSFALIKRAIQLSSLVAAGLMMAATVSAPVQAAQPVKSTTDNTSYTAEAVQRIVEGPYYVKDYCDIAARNHWAAYNGQCLLDSEWPGPNWRWWIWADR